MLSLYYLPQCEFERLKICGREKKNVILFAIKPGIAVTAEPLLWHLFK